MKKVMYVAILLGIFAGGCNSVNTRMVKVGNSNIDQQTENLIAFWLTYPDRDDKAILVTEPVAVYMEWYEDFKLFYLYDNIQKTTFKTTNFDIFLEAISNLPEGTEIQRFETCSRPRLYDIPRSKSEKMASVFIDKKLRWATNKVNGTDKEIVCYCESNGFRYP